MTAVLLDNQESPRDQDPDDSVASAHLQTISEPADSMNDTQRFQKDQDSVNWRTSL